MPYEDFCWGYHAIIYLSYLVNSIAIILLVYQKNTPVMVEVMVQKDNRIQYLTCNREQQYINYIYSTTIISITTIVITGILQAIEYVDYHQLAAIVIIAINLYIHQHYAIDHRMHEFRKAQLNRPDYQCQMIKIQ